MKISKVDGLVGDLGISSYQIDSGYRGFSYMNNGNLDMRFDNKSGISAKELLNNINDLELSKIIKQFGQEKQHKKIAKNIVKYSKKGEMNTTFDLKDAIKEMVNERYLNKTLSRVFQAIRIISNEEMNTLKDTLKKTFNYLNKGGRIAVITFHSIEDRIIKHFFKDSVIYKNSTYEIEFKLKENVFKLVNKKPITPNSQEIKDNPRSRSAKLRIAERV